MLRRIISAACLTVGLLGAAVPARAQGCIMCYTSALAASKSVQDGLRSGVLTLLIPVAFLLMVMAVLVWRSARPAKPATNL